MGVYSPTCIATGSNAGTSVMSLTPVEVFEQHEAANRDYGTRRVPDHIRNAQRHRTYQGYNRESSYSNVSRHRATNVQRPPQTVTSSETSFSNPEPSRAPGLRRRLNVPSAQRSQGEIARDVLRARNPSTSINIPESFETTGLLSGSAAGASGTASTGSILAAGGATVAGAAALGGLTHALVSRYKDKGAVLPGTDYVGPGNKIHIDAPRSGSDAIAKEHDVGYERIQKLAHEGRLSQEEFTRNIEQLDEDAIRKFAENFKTSGEWQSFVGRWGLYFKNRIERVTGTLYPSVTGKQWGAYGKIFILLKRIIGKI